MPTKIPSKSVSGGRFFSGKLGAFRQALLDRHNRHYRDNYFHLWADLLLGGIIIGLLVCVIWLAFWQPTPAFSLEGKISSSRILSGERVTFSAEYANGEEDAINAAEVSFVLPENFVFESADPAASFDAKNNTFRLGDLPKNGKGTVSVTGIIIGAPQSHQALGMAVSYQHNRASKRLLNSLPYMIDGSVLELTLEVPERVYAETDFRGTLQVKNSGEAPLAGIDISFPDLAWDVATDSPASENNHLVLESLASGETRSLDFTARSLQKGDAEFSAEAALKLESGIIRQAHVARNINIAESSLLVVPSLSPTAISPLVPATGLEIAFTNLEQSALEDVSFSLRPNRGDVSVNRLDSKTPRAAVRGATLVVGRLEPSEKGSIQALVELERKNAQLNDSSSFSIDVAYTFNGQQYNYAVSAGTLKFNSNLNLSSAGYYYGPQGDQLGIGPVPPRIDIPTTYWVIWQVNNLGNDVGAMEVTADLPGNIAWTDQKSVTVGSLDYSPVTRRVIWRPGDIKAGGGNYRASFAVSLVPRPQDLGLVPNLLEKIRFTAKDSFTGAVLSRDSANITTNIEQDKLSAGKGTVLPTE